MAESLILSDGTRTYDFLATSAAIYVAPDGIGLPVVSKDNTYAEGSDSEGRTRIRSRAQNSEAGSLTLQFRASTAATFWDAIDNLQELVESAHLNKGTLAYTKYGSTSSVTYDLESIQVTGLPIKGVHSAQRHAEATITFESKPYGRLPTQRLNVQDSYQAMVTALSPSIFLPLGASSGLTDLSGNARNGTAAGGVTVGGATGPLTVSDGGATDFDGTDDRITTTYATRRNLVTNPSFESALTGWTDVGSSVTTRDTSTSYDGTACALVASANNSSNGPGTTSPATELLTYTASAYVKAFDAGEVGKTVRILLRETPSNSQTTASVVLSAAWQRVSVTRTFTAGQTGALVWVIPTATNSPKYYLDAVQLEQASSADTYFPTTAQLASGEAGWTGTANASASDIGCFSSGTSRTLMGWVYRDATTNADVIFSAVTSDSSARSFLRLASGGTGVEWSWNSSPTTLTGAAIPAGAWTHWALVRTLNTGTVTFYVNGVEAYTGSPAFPAVDMTGMTWTGLQFGVRAATLDPFDGKQAWVSVHQSALTATQIRDCYDAGKAQITLDGPIDSFVVSGVTGQVNAWPDFTLYESSGATVNHVEIGVLNEYVAASAPAILLQAVTQITALGGSSNTRASSYSTNILRAALATTPVAVGEATGQNNKGGWKVRARIYPSATTVRVRLAWRVGSGPYAHEPWRTVPGSAAWYDVDLGSVTIPEISVGTHSVTFRLEAMSTSGSPTVDLDVFEILPTDSYMRLRGSSSLDTPTASVIAMDDFSTQTSGAVTGKTPLLVPSGTWSGAGDTDDFQVDTTSQSIYRDAISDSALNNGRYLRCGSGTLALTTVTCDFRCDTAGYYSGREDVGYYSGRFGVFLRYTDTSNWLMAVILNPLEFSLVKRVAGTETVLGSTVSSDGLFGTITITAAADATGNVLAAASRLGVTVAGLFVSADSSLATAGALASGGYGVYDAESAGSSLPRYYDNFNVFTGSSSATISNPVILSGGAVEVTNNKAVTRNAGATAWADTPVREGKYPTLPPATRNSSKSLVVVKARRNDVDSAYTDTNLTDKLLLTASVTPRVHLTGT